MHSLIVPILVPFLTAMVLVLVNGKYRLEKAISAVSSLGLTVWVFWLMYHIDAHGIEAMVVGGHQAPWGIAFVADRLACIMLCLSMSVASVVLIYTFWTATKPQQRYFFYPLFFIMLVGVNWSFLTGDLFNLFVAYEVMLIGSYGMMMVGASRAQVRQTMKYMAINTVGSTLFVVSCGLIYATVGTLNMADLAQRTDGLSGSRSALVTAVSMVLLVVFALKTAAFPLFFWLPDSYPVVPAGVNGFFAGLLTKVGVYSLLRMFVMVFQHEDSGFALHVLLVMSGFTMLLGVLGAMCQWEIRRILSWHIISQVGYMVMGIGLAANPKTDIAQIAIAGTIFYVVHHIIVKSCLFLIGGIAQRVAGSQELKRMGGVLELSPCLAGLFLVAALSLSGMPPFSGFLSKFVLVRAGLKGGNYIVVLVSIVTSFLTLYSMIKIWSFAFWHGKCRLQAVSHYRGMMVPTAVLVVFTIAMGLWGQPFLRLAKDTAGELIDPQGYITAVRGTAPLPRTPIGRASPQLPCREGSTRGVWSWGEHDLRHKGTPTESGQAPARGHRGVTLRTKINRRFLPSLWEGRGPQVKTHHEIWTSRLVRLGTFHARPLVLGPVPIPSGCLLAFMPILDHRGLQSVSSDFAINHADNRELHS